MQKKNEKSIRIGVYICHCGTNISHTVDVRDLERFSSSLPYVSVVRSYPYMCSYQGQNMIIEDIKAKKLNRVVVAACSPRMHEQTFRACCEKAGMNPYLFEQVNIREQCSWVHEDVAKATEKAKSLIKAAVARASLLEPLEEREIPVTPASLVIGGGIAGIQASLDIANAGFHVYLVEKEPSIGGHMAQLDKTFPTLDCSACILTPKMSEVEHHENITLITNAEVESVEGYVGNFHVVIRKKPRYVDEDRCTGCGLCAEACRLRNKIPNEFDLGMSKRSAIYIPFPQAVPSVYLVDSERCLMIKKGKCGKKPPCIDACKSNAINFNQKEETIGINVGTIIVATGYDLYIPPAGIYGYGEKGVITALELERIMSASGPTGGEIVVNGREPKKILFISCVGSRELPHVSHSSHLSHSPSSHSLHSPHPPHLSLSSRLSVDERRQERAQEQKSGEESKRDEENERRYCSRICCMYIAKQAHLIKEKIPDSEITVLYTDVRAFGKGFEEFYQRVRSEGVKYVRRELDEPIEVRQKGDIVVVNAVCEGVKRRFECDLVVLATAVVPRKDASEIARKLGLSRKRSGFFLEAHPKLRPVETLTDGIFIAGCCQSPKDIQDTVSQASAAASAALKLLFAGKYKIGAITAVIDADKCISCGLCVDTCTFNAISIEEKRIEQVLCKGCGVCAATCPTGAIKQKHFTDNQIAAQIKNIL